MHLRMEILVLVTSGSSTRITSTSVFNWLIHTIQTSTSSLKMDSFISESFCKQLSPLVDSKVAIGLISR